MAESKALALLGWATILGLLVTPLPALADPSGDGRMTARWESVHAPSVAHGVKINGTWRAAGEAYLRIDNQADDAVYSLSLATAVDRTTQLNAIDADSSEIPQLDQITSLVRDSATEATHGTLTNARAAAYQIAIWHLTDNLSVDSAHVPRRAIRAMVKELIHRSATETDQNRKCTGSQCPTLRSTAQTEATLNVRLGSTVNDTVLRIAIITPIKRFFNHRQYVDLRINGLGATLCPGEIDRIRVDKPATHDVLKSSCEFRGHDPSEKSPRFAGLARLIVERVSTLPKSDIVTNTITAFIPRQDTSQEIQMNWPFTNGPGMVFIPTSPSSPVITASSFDDSRTATITVDPGDFASFQEVVQRTVLPIFTGHGAWGLILLGLIFVLLLAIKDLVVGIAKLAGKMLRMLGGRTWSWRKRKADERKAKRAQKAA